MTDSIKISFVVFSTFFIPIHGILMALTYVILFDLVTGLLSSWKSGIPIKNSKIMETLPKVLIYNLMIVGVYLFDIHLLQDFTQYITKIQFVSTKIVGSFIFLIELSSVVRNLESAFNVQFLNIFRRWKTVIGKEAIDVKKITGNVKSVVENLRGMSKDDENSKGYKGRRKGRSSYYHDYYDNEESNLGETN